MKLTKEDKAMLRKEYEKVWHRRDGSVDEGMVDHCVKSASGCIWFGDTLHVEDKPHIKTDFWFGEHTYDYDEVCEYRDGASKSVEYFRRENMERCEAYDNLQALEGEGRYEGAYHYNAYLRTAKYCTQDDSCHLGEVSVVRATEDPERLFHGGYRVLTDDEVEAYKEFLRGEVEKFDKRITTYLKRYGLSKCHYSVYWADR